MVTVPVLQEELLVVTAAKHPLAKKRRVNAAATWRVSRSCSSRSGSNTRRVIDEFFAASGIEPRHRDGDRERRDHQGARAPRPRDHDRLVPVGGARRGQRPPLLRAHRRRPLIRETGWVYPKMSRTPRAVEEVSRRSTRSRPAPAPGALDAAPRALRRWRGAARLTRYGRARRPRGCARFGDHAAEHGHRLGDLRRAQRDEAQAHACARRVARRRTARPARTPRRPSTAVSSSGIASKPSGRRSQKNMPPAARATSCRPACARAARRPSRRAAAGSARGSSARGGRGSRP